MWYSRFRVRASGFRSSVEAELGFEDSELFGVSGWGFRVWGVRLHFPQGGTVLGREFPGLMLRVSQNFRGQCRRSSSSRSSSRSSSSSSRSSSSSSSSRSSASRSRSRSRGRSTSRSRSRSTSNSSSSGSFRSSSCCTSDFPSLA